MTKTCNVCHHTGELTWRDGKYYCAMCGSEVAETEPVAQTQRASTVNNATCPICKNRENNLFDGYKYRCGLCGTPFDLHQEFHVPTHNAPNSNRFNREQYAAELKKKKNKNIGLGILFVMFFWPVSIYFFYKAYQTNKELMVLGY